jgi:hypothetical protein
MFQFDLSYVYNGRGCGTTEEDTCKFCLVVFGGRRSIQLSYARAATQITGMRIFAQLVFARKNKRDGARPSLCKLNVQLN